MLKGTINPLKINLIHNSCKTHASEFSLEELPKLLLSTANSKGYSLFFISHGKLIEKR
jgi:hypothetical protein